MRALLAAAILVTCLVCTLSAEGLPNSAGVQQSLTKVTDTLLFSPQFSGTSAVYASGTWSGNVIAQASYDKGSNWVTVPLTSQSTGQTMALTANGAFFVENLGASLIRLSVTAWTSGTVVMNIRNAPQAPILNRQANVLKPVIAVATTGVLWLPTSSKKFRLMGFDLAGSAAGNILLFDGTNTITAHSTAAAGHGQPVYLGGNGYLSSAGGTSLTATSGGGGTISGAVWGTEE